MNTARFGLLAALPLLALLQGCTGGTKPGFHQDFDVSQHLPQNGRPWVNQKPVQTQVKIGPDSSVVTVEWIPAHQDQHRGISKVTVRFPQHRNSDTYTATISTPVNHGTRNAVMESLTVYLRWTRDSVASDHLAGASVQLIGDGTSTIL